MWLAITAEIAAGAERRCEALVPCTARAGEAGFGPAARASAQRCCGLRADKVTTQAIGCGVPHSPQIKQLHIEYVIEYVNVRGMTSSIAAVNEIKDDQR